MLLGPIVPLTIGIHEQLAAMLPAGHERKVCFTLAAHTSNDAYLAAMQCDAPPTVRRGRRDRQRSRLHADTKLSAKLARDAAKAATGALSGKPAASLALRPSAPHDSPTGAPNAGQPTLGWLGRAAPTPSKA